MATTRFWCLTAPKNTKRLDWDRSAGKRNVPQICPLNPSHNGSGRRTGDLHLIAPDECLNDFAWTSFSDCLIKDWVADEFSRHEFSGFVAGPVHFDSESAPNGIVVGLLELRVVGWGGVAARESGITRIERCPVCGRQKYSGFTRPGLLVNESEWDGSDFFMVWPMPLYIFVTAGVARCIQDQAMTGVEVVEVGKLPAARGFSPGGLRLWMPDERARRLGESVDIY